MRWPAALVGSKEAGLSTTAGDDVNRPEIVREVTERFERYEAALVSNDVDVLSELFWADPRTVRYGDRENLYGHEEIEVFRKSRPVGDLRRDLGRRVVTTFGTDAATTSVEFTRTRSGGRGRQTQTWIRTADGWRIVAAHVSLLPAGA